MRREREQALLVEKSKQEEKERRKLEQQLAKEAKEAKKKAGKDKKVNRPRRSCCSAPCDRFALDCRWEGCRPADHY